MQQSEFQQIREWYQQFEDAVLFYRMDGTPLWQNHAATLRQDQDGASLPRYAPDGTPETGTFSVRQGSVLYLLRQKQCRIGGTPVILVQICAQPEEELFWSDPDRCHEEENRIAAIRQKVFGISNAVSALYQDLDESSDQIPRMILEEQLEQLNIIQGNCCRLMRSSVLRLEQLKYYQNCEVSGEALFLDRELSNFVESCRMVLGRAIRMTLNTAPHLCIFVHRRRNRSYSTSAGSITPSCSPPRPTPRHSVPCAFPCTGTSGICPWKAAAGRSTTASFRCIRSSFPTFRTTGFIKQHIATHSVKPFRSCRLCGNS